MMNDSIEEIEKNLLQTHLIDKYRDLVFQRYNYADIKSRFELSENIKPATVKQIRSYFLKYIYTNASEREELDESFILLKSFIYKPSKMWHLLGNMTSAIFKFGRLFPLALKAGFKSLQSYIQAKKIEESLLDSALELGYTIPLRDEDFKKCLQKIPAKKAKAFVKDVIGLLNQLTNEKLLIETIGILNGIIEKMKNFPETYSEKEIKGIVTGLDIIENGYNIFKDFDTKTKKDIVSIVTSNELWFLEQIYKNS